jgi:hypothetical protein
MVSVTVMAARRASCSVMACGGVVAGKGKGQKTAGRPAEPDLPPDCLRRRRGCALAAKERLTSSRDLGFQGRTGF